jgi:hypothetical protein
MLITSSSSLGKLCIQKQQEKWSACYKQLMINGCHDEKGWDTGQLWYCRQHYDQVSGREHESFSFPFAAKAIMTPSDIGT